MTEIISHLPGNESTWKHQQLREIEWPTFAIVGLCVILLPAITLFGSTITLFAAVPALMIVLALHSSLQHEVLHGHPFNNERLNEALVFIPFGIFIPYRRFRETHLQHHFDPNLTDPYDDPESNYLDPAVWNRMSKPLRLLLIMNNTLAGRMLFGPAISLYSLYVDDLKAMAHGNRTIILAYVLYILGMIPLVWWLAAYTTMPFWAYILSCYGALSLLKVRTFLEHRAHEKVPARTVIIEDRGFFAWLFLNNNYHLVHHSCPKAAWYKLPGLFEQRREDFSRRNEGYYYSNYAMIFRQYFFHTKDRLPHPLWPNGNAEKEMHINKSATGNEANG